MSQGERANRIGCAEFRRNLAMDRRGFVKAGALGLGGLSLANLMRAEEAVKNRDAVSNDKCVIILWKRGLMDRVMVVAWGEFGRTPKVNKAGGRDHYPGMFSAALSGGGIQGGAVVGSSASKGALPKDRPLRPQDVLATMYRHLGIDTKINYTDFAGRPHPVLPFGEPIEELF